MADNLATTDAAIQQIITTVGGQLDSMSQAYQAVQTIMSEVPANFQSHSSTTFQNAMRNWMDDYTNLIQKFHMFQDHYSHGAGQIGDANYQATGIASTVYSGLR